MPNHSLFVKAELENVSEVHVGKGAPYKVRIQCTNCREPSDKASFIDPAVEEAVPGGRGVANLVQRCKFCSRNSNVKFVSGSAKPYTGGDEEPVKVAEFECRGCELVEFFPQGGFLVVTPSGKEIEAEDLEEDFADFDDDLGEPVGVYSFSGYFE